MNEQRGYSIDRKSAVPAEVPPVVAPVTASPAPEPSGADLDQLLHVDLDAPYLGGALAAPIDESLPVSTEPETADLTEIAAEATADDRRNPPVDADDTQA